MAADALVSVTDVTQTFQRDRVTALRRVTVTVHRGEHVAITGPSGCGKSTLLHVLCGIEVPTTGTVAFEGRLVTARSEWVRLRARRVGLVYQAFNLLPTLTALENIEVPMFGVVASRRERETRARDLLARVGLADRARHLPSELSGGEQQRVAVARSLVNDPSLILADEPTGNLDSASALQVLELLEACRSDRGATLVVVSHDAMVARRADRVITLRDGAIVSAGEA